MIMIQLEEQLLNFNNKNNEMQICYRGVHKIICHHSSLAKKILGGTPFIQHRKCPMMLVTMSNLILSKKITKVRKVGLELFEKYKNPIFSINIRLRHLK